MDAPSWNSLVPVATLVLGYVGAAWQDERRGRQQEARELSRHQAEVAAGRAAREAEFQQRTLLALQEAVVRLIRTESQIFAWLSKEQSRTHQAWNTLRLPDELGEENRVARAEMSILLVRIKSDEVRTLAASIRDAPVVASSGIGEDEALRNLQAMWRLFGPTNDRIGEEIRHTY